MTIEAAFLCWLIVYFLLDLPGKCRGWMASGKRINLFTAWRIDFALIHKHSFMISLNVVSGAVSK